MAKPAQFVGAFSLLLGLILASITTTARAATVVKVGPNGAAGANGANGTFSAGAGQPGTGGGSATAQTSAPLDNSNTSIATGGNGGAGGTGGATSMQSNGASGRRRRRRWRCTGNRLARGSAGIVDFDRCCHRRERWRWGQRRGRWKWLLGTWRRGRERRECNIIRRRSRSPRYRGWCELKRETKSRCRPFRPEPGTLALLISGRLAIFFRRRAERGPGQDSPSTSRAFVHKRRTLQRSVCVAFG